MSVRNVKRGGVIFQELGKPSTEVHILLSGAAQLSHLNGDGPRVVAMMMPGVIFRLPQMPPEVGHNFEWVALSDCRVGRLPIERYVAITLGVDYDAYARVSEPAESRIGRILARYPSFIGFALLQRVAVALIELAVEFGVQNHRGVVLGIVPTHKTARRPGRRFAAQGKRSHERPAAAQGALARRTQAHGCDEAAGGHRRRAARMALSVLLLAPRLELQAPLVGPVLVAELVPRRRPSQLRCSTSSVTTVTPLDRNHS